MISSPSEDEENLKALHLGAISLMKSLPVSRESIVLEIGPARLTGASNSGFWERNPDVFFDFGRWCMGRGASYHCLDVDSSVSPTYLGSIEAPKSPLPSNHYSVVVASSVLEHVGDLIVAIRNIADSLCDGGLFLAVTPWDLRFHGPRPDNWRISDDGYRFLLRDHFEKVQFHLIPNPQRPLSPFGVGVLAHRIRREQFED